MALAPCRVTPHASSLTIVGVSPLTSASSNSVRMAKSRTYRRTSVLDWRPPHDSDGFLHGADRALAKKLTPCGRRWSTAGGRCVLARPRAVPAFLSLRLSLLDWHGAGVPGHLADASCGRREVGHADSPALRSGRSNSALHGLTLASRFIRHGYPIRLDTAPGGA